MSTGFPASYLFGRDRGLCVFTAITPCTEEQEAGKIKWSESDLGVIVLTFKILNMYQGHTEY